MGLSVRVDASRLDRRFGPAARGRVQESFAMRAELLMRKYVPYREGPLRDSAKVSSRYRTGRIVYNTPYARRQYREESYAHAGGRTDHWDKMMVKRDGKGLRAYAAKLYGRRG